MLTHLLQKWRDKFWRKKLMAGYAYFDSNPEKVYRIALKVFSKARAQSKLRADCYEFISEYWRLQNDFKQAERYLLKSIGIYTALSGENDLLILKMQLGYLYDTFHYYDEALSTYEASIAIAEAHHNYKNLYSVMMLKADVLVELRAFEKAEELWTKIIRELKGLELFEEISVAYGKLGDFHNEFRNFVEAEKAYLEGLRYLEYAHEPELTRINTYVSLIEIYRTGVVSGEEHFSKEKLKECIATVENDTVLQQNPNIRFMLLQYYIDQKEYAFAKTFMRALEQDYLKNHQFIWLQYLYPATIRLFQETNDFEGGCTAFIKSIRLLENEELWAMLWLVYDLYGSFLNHFDKKEEALQYYIKSADALETYRFSIPDGFDRITFFDDKVHYLIHYASFSLENNNLTLALTFLEKSKGKSLIDLLSTEQKVDVLRFAEIQNYLLR